MLGGLTKIHEFCVRDNDIRDISVVLNYPKLYWLEISDNPNLDRSPLKQLSDKVKIK
jgi:Leucine-rich repeat (LRR) protein